MPRDPWRIQTHLEDVQAAQFPGQILLCDRGTVDGAAYWPESNDGGGFFEAMETTVEDELQRYHHVIFFETAAVGGLSIDSGNPARIESLQAAVELDERLRGLWGQHPRFHFIPHGPSFLAKITSALHTLTEILADGRSNGPVGWPRGIAPPRLPQIRTCRIPASGSSVSGVRFHSGVRWP